MAPKEGSVFFVLGKVRARAANPHISAPAYLRTSPGLLAYPDGFSVPGLQEAWQSVGCAAVPQQGARSEPEGCTADQGGDQQPRQGGQ